MKKIFFIFLFLLIPSMGYCAEFSSTPLYPDDGFAYWKLSDLTDEYGHFDFTNVNSATFGTGKYGDGVDMGTGGNASLQYNGSLLYNQTHWTVSFWAKLNNEISADEWALWSDAFYNQSPYRMYQIEYVYNGGSRYLNFRADANGVSTQSIQRVGSLDDNTWHQYAMSYDGSQICGYFDGELVNCANFSDTGSPCCGSGNSLGSLYGGTFTSFNAQAQFDDLVISTSTLSEANILTIYTDGTSTTTEASTTPGVFPPLNYYNDISIISDYHETWNGTTSSSTLISVTQGYYHVPAFLILLFSLLIIWIWSALLFVIISKKCKQ